MSLRICLFSTLQLYVKVYMWPLYLVTSIYIWFAWFIHAVACVEMFIEWLSFACINDHVLLVDRHLTCFSFLWAYIFSSCRHIPRSGTGLCSMSRITRSSKYVRMRIREWLRRNEQCISNPYHIHNKHSRRMLVTSTLTTLIDWLIKWLKHDESAHIQKKKKADCWCKSPPCNHM